MLAILVLDLDTLALAFVLSKASIPAIAGGFRGKDGCKGRVEDADEPDSSFIRCSFASRAAILSSVLNTQN